MRTGDVDIRCKRQSKSLTFSAGDVRIECEASPTDGKLPSFEMTAYSGGLVRTAEVPLEFVIDLSSLRVATEQLPMLRDHDYNRPVGHGTELQNDLRTLTVKGVISQENNDAREIVAAAKNGYRWQASVGGGSKLEFVRAGSSVTVNGRTFNGPIYVSRNMQLREISFLAVGADPQTAVTISAAQSGAKTMNFEQWATEMGFDPVALTEQQRAALMISYNETQEQSTNAAVAAGAAKPTTQAAATPAGATTVVTATASDAELQAHRERMAKETERLGSLATINAKYGSKHHDVHAQAIKEGWEADKFELHCLRASRPSNVAIHVAGGGSPDFAVIRAAAVQSLSHSRQEIEQEFSAQQLDAAHKRFKGRMGLQEMLLECAAANGHSFRSFNSEPEAVIRAAFSTADAVNIFSNLANKFLLQGYNSVERAWQEFAATRPVKDFKVNTSYRLVAGGKFDKVAPDGELKHGKFSDQSYTNQVDTYGQIFAITRRDMINDDLGALQSLPMEIGRNSARTLNDVFWTAWFNDSSFFTSGNKNLNASCALSQENLATPVAGLFTQTDPNGFPLSLEGAMLLVPAQLRTVAESLFNSQDLIVSGGSNQKAIGVKNIYAGKYRPVVSSYLSNASYGNSASTWYLLADPRSSGIATIEVAFLDGNQQPIVEQVQAAPDVLGIQYRGYFDFGVNFQDFRGAQKCTA